MKAKPATTEQKRRFEAMGQLGCIACIIEHGAHQVECGRLEIHHFVSRTRPDTHDITAPLGLWHHQGVLMAYPMLAAKDTLRYVGPSWHKHRRAFRERYGSDAQVVAKVNELLAEKGLYPC